MLLLCLKIDYLPVVVVAHRQDQADEFQDTMGSGEQFISIRDYVTL